MQMRRTAGASQVRSSPSCRNVGRSAKAGARLGRGWQSRSRAMRWRGRRPASPIPPPPHPHPPTHPPNPLCPCSIPPAALHLASRHARLACVKVLLEAGARQLCDRQGCTPRQLAEQSGHTDVLDMVRQHEEVQAELQRQADGQQRRLAEGGRPAGEEGT